MALWSAQGTNFGSVSKLAHLVTAEVSTDSKLALARRSLGRPIARPPKNLANSETLRFGANEERVVG